MGQLSPEIYRNDTNQLAITTAQIAINRENSTPRLTHTLDDYPKVIVLACLGRSCILKGDIPRV